ncbi:DUF4065 domain-containing protein [Chryseobacterium gotjawalense]|uniref:DUF4065 domain-containing protein n=1 Tax=Chryseobacterium gotjawalense TaxID=3042315 RepID=A0ABY8RF24_9FLAO|nr:type II toxin-antitoxin system antitoxin SocA domain-containing protein [Chryseobacterium sp. wdc7]WHF51783.1 DUF4065 domain-containing protein [Chryseobacterium sp. wdc7]
MKSPFTGKEMKLTKEKRTVSFRKQKIEYTNLSYFCEQSNESFVSTELEELNIKQIHNKYRELNNIPFPEEIKKLRQHYGLAAAKMSELFGFGPNQYALYEGGDMPSISNAKSISLALDPLVFKKMIEENRVIIKEKEFKSIVSKITTVMMDECDFFIEDYLLGDHNPTAFTGYKTPSFEKLSNMTVFFAEHLKPHKTTLNKLLFYADFGHYKNHASSITGCRYAAIPYGPVPDKFNSLFDKMRSDCFINVEYKEYPNGSLGEKFVPNSKFVFNESLFEKTELDVMEKVKDDFKGKSSKAVVEISHRETAWLENQEDRSLINYEHAFDLNLL